MKMLNVTVVLIAMLSLTWPECANAASPVWPAWMSKPGDDLLHGKLPNENVKNWVMLTLLIPRSSPLPVVLVSPTTFKVDRLQELVPLSDARYKSFAQLTRSNSCQQTSGDYLPSEALEITEHANGKTRVLCRMPLSAACGYLNAVGEAPSLGWTEHRWKPFREVSAILHC